MRLVRTHQLHPPDYARFVAALPNVRTILVDSLAMAEALRTEGELARITGLEFRARTHDETILRVLAPVAEVAPAVTTLALHVAPSVEQALEVRAMFPRLAEIVIESPPADQAARDALALLPGIRFGS